GGQPGHKGSYRQLLPADQVDKIVDIFPQRCDVCFEKPPHILEQDPERHQVVELLEFGGRFITEYRLHTVDCACGEKVTAERDQVPSSAFGPRLSATVCLMTGDCQMSRRQVPVFLKEVFGIDMSLGSVSNIEGRMSKALAAPSDEAMARVEASMVKHVDETSWIRDAQRCSAWVFASLVATVIRVAKNGRRSTLRKLLKRSRGTLISDRATVFLYWAMARRQICWSHLLRMFIAFSQRDGPAGALGRELVEYAELVFIYWRQHRSGGLSRESYMRRIEAVREGMKPCLRRAVQAKISTMSGSCANMLKHWEAMWTFVHTPGVEPTNNHAERELRRLVIWRKRCFGTQSNRGDRFVERMLTVTHTARKQGHRALAFLHQSYTAMLSAAPPPSLFAAA
ncbi:IS66 family transposase, partial [Myxococcota bacterium]